MFYTYPYLALGSSYVFTLTFVLLMVLLYMLIDIRHAMQDSARQSLAAPNQDPDTVMLSENTLKEVEKKTLKRQQAILKPMPLLIMASILALVSSIWFVSRAVATDYPEHYVNGLNTVMVILLVLMALQAPVSVYLAVKLVKTYRSIPKFREVNKLGVEPGLKVKRETVLSKMAHLSMFSALWYAHFLAFCLTTVIFKLII